MILWFGWYGFNPGSQLAIVNGNSLAVANAAVTTTLAPGAAGLSALFFSAFLGRGRAGRMTYDVGVMGNGALAGLVAITAGCSVVYPWGAIAIGIVAGLLYVIGSRVSVLIKCDDPLDAIAVHAWNGTWGVIAVGFFAGDGLITQAYGLNPFTGEQRQYGCFLGGDGHLLGAQIIYALWLGGWVLANMVPFWFALKFLGWFRVPANEETMGLDDSYHGGTAYPGHGHDDFLDKSSAGNNKVNGDAEMNGAGYDKEEFAQLKAEVAALKSSIAK
jgi:Amt family ammonium transporter